MKTFSFPGIRSVSSVDMAMLAPDLMYKSIAGVALAVDDEYCKRVEICGKSDCTVTETHEKGVPEQKTVLKFRSTSLPDRTTPQAWVFTTADGERYLIGTAEGPVPAVSVSDTTGEPSGDASVKEVEIALTSRRSLIKL